MRLKKPNQLCIDKYLHGRSVDTSPRIKGFLGVEGERLHNFIFIYDCI